MVRERQYTHAQTKGQRSIMTHEITEISDLGGTFEKPLFRE